ncbi:MAG: hypothetical protein IJL63_02480 [Clostridia bacterium]|nr:hypothetical protein [Clostridia bacterium]
MQRNRNYLVGYGIGFVVSVVFAIVMAFLTNLTAINTVTAFIYVFWGISGLALITAFVLAMLNNYDYDRSLDCQLNNHILLLITACTLVAVFTSVLGILISTAAVTDLLVKVFTGLAVFSLGLVITAVFSFIYWLIKTTVNTNEN